MSDRKEGANTFSVFTWNVLADCCCKDDDEGFPFTSAQARDAKTRKQLQLSIIENTTEWVYERGYTKSKRTEMGIFYKKTRKDQNGEKDVQQKIEDYIFFRGDNLALETFRECDHIEPSDVSSIGLPNEKFPSDHLTLGATFRVIN